VQTRQHSDPRLPSQWKVVRTGVQKLEDDMQLNLSHVDPNFLCKVAMQVQYLQSTKQGLERVLGTVTGAPDKKQRN
jgi:hypothetical protein